MLHQTFGLMWFEKDLDYKITFWTGGSIYCIYNYQMEIVSEPAFFHMPNLLE